MKKRNCNTLLLSFAIHPEPIIQHQKNPDPTHQIGLKMMGVHRTPCECRAVCMGETGCTVEDHTNEHRDLHSLYL